MDQGSGSDALTVTVKELSALSIAAWKDLLGATCYVINNAFHAYKLSRMYCPMYLMSTFTVTALQQACKQEAVSTTVLIQMFVECQCTSRSS